jgi:Tol biopolymer transport system component
MYVHVGFAMALILSVLVAVVFCAVGWLCESRAKREEKAMRFVQVGAICLTLVWVQVLVPLPLAGQQQDAEVLLQQAMHAEQVDGDLDQAISLYRQLVEQHGNERPVAAQALLRLGLCYERLGREEATNAYERLLAEYGDQSEMVTEARARLAVLRGNVTVATSDGPVARRLLESDGCTVSYLRPSPDGTRVAYSNSCIPLAVFVRDLASGEVVQHTHQGEHFGIAWSADGNRVASAELGSHSQLKLIDLRTGNIEEPAFMTGVKFIPDDWSPDGNYLTGTVTADDRSVTLELVSLGTQERVVLTDEVASSNPRAAFSPDGRYVAFADFTGDNQDIYVQNVATGERARLTDGPEGEHGAVWSPDGRTIVYLNQSGSWAVRVADGRAEGVPQLIRNEPYGTPTTTGTWTPAGFYYWSMNTVSHGYRIPIDPETATRVGAPEPMVEALPGMTWRTQFAWSPDMERVASSGGENPQYVHVARGQSLASFHVGDERNVRWLWWSRDGSEILYTTWGGSRRDQRTTVYGLNPANGNTRELFPPVDSMFNVHVSPDGSKITFFRPFRVPREDVDTHVGELVVADLGDPANGLVLASSSDAEGWLRTNTGMPAFSPDGRWILFPRIRTIGEREDQYEMTLWVAPSDGSGSQRLLATASAIGVAVWHPSSRWVVFIEIHGSDPREMRGALSAVAVETGEKHEILGQEEIEALGSSSPDIKTVSPDGRWVGISLTTGNFEYWVVDDPLGAVGEEN